eukprot:scaffold51129_cov19-Tisochrysis_lutea.AAC.5
MQAWQLGCKAVCSEALDRCKKITRPSWKIMTGTHEGSATTCKQALSGYPAFAAFKQKRDCTVDTKVPVPPPG